MQVAIIIVGVQITPGKVKDEVTITQIRVNIDQGAIMEEIMIEDILNNMTEDIVKGKIQVLEINHHTEIEVTIVAIVIEVTIIEIMINSNSMIKRNKKSLSQMNFNSFGIILAQFFEMFFHRRAIKRFIRPNGDFHGFQAEGTQQIHACA